MLLKTARQSKKIQFMTLSAMRPFGYITLPANTNQAEGLANYAINFLQQDNGKIDDSVYERTRLFHTDSVLCGISALA